MINLNCHLQYFVVLQNKFTFETSQSSILRIPRATPGTSASFLILFKFGQNFLKQKKDIDKFVIQY